MAPADLVSMGDDVLHRSTVSGVLLPTRDDQSPAEPRWWELDSQYDPGQFVFDYFNDRQLADVAQSLGLDLSQSRQITRQTQSKGDMKFSLKVIEVTAGRQDGTAVASTYGGPMHTATLLQIVGQLSKARRLQILSQPKTDDPSGILAACRAASSQGAWVIIEGDWQVSEGLSLTLVRPAGAMSDLTADQFNLHTDIPADRDELLPTGRVRLAPGRRIGAVVFGYIEDLIEVDRTVTVIALAEFARIGDPRFTWSGASFGDNPNGDF